MMGRCLTKRMILVLTTILLLHLVISSSSGESVKKPNENGVCISEGERFSPYESEGKPVKSADKDSKIFHGKTCCSVSQMHTALLSFENMATHREGVINCLGSLFFKNVDTYGEAVRDCLDLFELLDCLICHQNVVTQSGTLSNCTSSCDRVVEAYFRRNTNNQIIVPCGENEGGVICGKASKWQSNGTAFCNAVGFTVQTADDSLEEPCYRSISSLEPVVESLIKAENFIWFQDVQKLVREVVWELQVYMFFRGCSQLWMLFMILRSAGAMIRNA